MSATWRGPDMPVVMAYLTVRDPTASLAFYQKAFGFAPLGEPLVEAGKIVHAEMKWHEGVIMFGPEGGFGAEAKSPASSGVPSPLGLYVYCEDVDALYARALAAGATSVSAPQDMFWGDRVCKVKDPDGFTWSFGTFKGPPK